MSEDRLSPVELARWMEVYQFVPQGSPEHVILMQAVAESLHEHEHRVLTLLRGRVLCLPLQDPSCTLQGRMQNQMKEQVVRLLGFLIKQLEEDGPATVSAPETDDVEDDK